LKTVLIIDDDPADQKMMADILHQEGYQTRSAGIGPEGISSARKQPPDLIILDLVMPDMNGIEALREFRKELPAVPVVMCSRAGLEQVVALALRVGAAGYIIKPYNRELVIRTINSEIGS